MPQTWLLVTFTLPFLANCHRSADAGPTGFAEMGPVVFTHAGPRILARRGARFSADLHQGRDQAPSPVTDFPFPQEQEREIMCFEGSKETPGTRARPGSRSVADG